ncbi:MULTISPECIES: TolC family protein [Chryseobacterium]|uniref:Outer membrane efflux protein n=2 Tax=Chryseobacterium gleum TaxID=250 RepID=A0A448B956_CHRGE|nr:MULTISPECIES: TolC family protein [Chryseobacterium]EFK36129.1 hypothetical protein HMPREF0204_15198 [Chryseobacterium gleum ATCC 35910]QQY31827.1 TolC family protein [Chryseobacterium gleum]VEE11077.1 Outer membrane efflux protein [Chryseobacterium gleum]VFA43945.1 Outer membrane efflux protein [Chryseobacterium indologenes]
MVKKIQLLFLILVAFNPHKLMAQRNLNDFIRIATTNAPMLKTNILQSKANEIETKRILAGLTKPLVTAQMDYMMAPVYANDADNRGIKINPSKSITDYYGLDFSATNGGLYKGVLTLDQPLFNKKRIDMAQQQMKIQNELLGNSSILAVHDIEKLITDQYILCLQDIGQREAMRHTSEITQQQIAIVQKLSTSGLSRLSDAKLLTIELSQQQTAIKTLQNSYQVHLLELYSLCGITKTDIVELDPLAIEIHNPPKVDSSGFIKQYKLDSLNLETNRKLFNLQYLPTVSLYSTAGLYADYLSDIPKRFGMLIGIRFTQKIFDGNQRKLNDEKLRVLQEATTINSNFFKSKNENRKKAFMELINSQQEQITSIDRQINEYEELLKYYQKQIAAGQGSVIEYLTTLRSNTALLNNRVSLHTARLWTINNYNYWNW